MYNVHQFNQAVRTQERLKYQEQQYAKYLLKHEDYKEQALDKATTKVQAFIREQSESPKHFVFQDDHFARWRPHKQYRDVQDSNKFLSFKTFRHRPNYDMDKYFNERQRRQIKELSQRKENLIKSKIIPQQQRSRSLRCQGPLNPKIQFRQLKKDHEYLQPRLRFTNVTDKQRQNESAFSFDDKFKSLYSSFQMTKSKIGRTTVSPKRSQRYEGRDALDFIEQTNSQMSKSKPFYFNKEDNQPNQSASQLVPQLKEVSIKSNSQSTNPQPKNYFKMAKTLQLKSQDPQIKQQIQQVLKKTQYERTKHLTNIVHNNTTQNFYKKPIL